LKINDLFTKLKKTKEDIENQFWTGKGGDTLVKAQEWMESPTSRVPFFAPTKYKESDSDLMKLGKTAAEYGRGTVQSVLTEPLKIATDFGRSIPSGFGTKQSFKPASYSMRLGQNLEEYRGEKKPLGGASFKPTTGKWDIPLTNKKLPDFGLLETPAAKTAGLALGAFEPVFAAKGATMPKATAARFGLSGILGGGSEAAFGDRGFKEGALETIYKQAPDAATATGFLNSTNLVADKLPGSYLAKLPLRSAAEVLQGLGYDKITGAETDTVSVLIDALSPVIGDISQETFKKAVDAAKNFDFKRVKAILDPFSDRIVAEKMGNLEATIRKNSAGRAYDTSSGRFAVDPAKPERFKDISSRIAVNLFEGSPIDPGDLGIYESNPEMRKSVINELSKLEGGRGSVDFGAKIGGDVGGDKIPTDQDGKIKFKQSADKILEDARKEIGVPEEGATSLKESAKNFYNKFYTDWVNRFHPIEKLTTDVEKATNSKILPEKSPEYAITRFLGAGGTAELRHKQVLEPIMNRLGDVPKADFDVFLKAQRDIELSGRDVYGSDAAKARSQLEALGSKYDLNKLNNIAEQLYSYQRNNLAKLKEAGFLSNEAVKTISDANQKYVPFERVMDDIDTFLGIPSATAQQSSSPIKGIKGSKRNILSPLESIVANTYKTEAAVAKNRVAKSIVDLQKVMPDLGIEKVGKAEDAISVWENGQKSYYKVPQDVMEAVKGLNEENTNLLVKILSAPASMLRQGATGRNIDFMLPNVFRDQWDAAINSKYGYKPFLDYMDGLRHLVNYKRAGSDDLVEQWMDSGGKIFFENMSGRKDISSKAISEEESAGLLKKLHKWAISGIGEIGDLSEAPTRIGLYKRGLEATSNPLIAAKEAREGTLDFARMGAKMKTANSIIPFLNVGVQGFDQTVRTAKVNPGAFALKMTAYAGIPALMTSVYNNLFHGEDYGRIPDFVKQNNFVFIVGNKEDGTPKYITIPKGHVQQLVSNPTDNFVTWIAGNNPQTFSQLALSLFSDTVPILGQGDSLGSIARQTVGQNIPTAIKPAIENIANYNFFREREVVPYWLEDRPKYAQYKESTPMPYRAAGAVLNQSPLKLQNLAEGYLSGGVKQPVNALETLSSIGRGEDVNINKVPVARRFVGDYADWDNERPEKQGKDSLSERMSSLLPGASADTGMFSKFKGEKKTEESLPDLPSSTEELKIVYGDAIKDIEGYDKKKTRIEYGDYDSWEKKSKLKSLEEDYSRAKSIVEAAKSQAPEKVFEVELSTYGRDHPSGVLVEDRGKWVVDQLRGVEDEKKAQELVNKMWEEGVLTTGSRGTAQWLKDNYDIDINKYTGSDSKVKSKLGGGSSKLKIAAPPKIKFTPRKTEVVPIAGVRSQSSAPQATSRVPIKSPKLSQTSKLSMRDLYSAFDR